MAVNMNKLVLAIEICAEDATQEYVDYIFGTDEYEVSVFDTPTAIALKAKAEVFTDLLDALKAMEYKDGMDKS